MTDPPDPPGVTVVRVDRPDRDDLKPRFKHDCDQCVLLGLADDFTPTAAGTYDVYFCPQPAFGPTLIARYGDDGPEYVSWNLQVIEIVLSQPTYPLRNVFHFALTTAVRLGLVPVTGRVTS